MKKQQLVSVLISTYNREKLLPKAINSVLNQTYKNWELIIVDDRSTDDTKKVVENYIKKNKRIGYVRNTHKKGLAGGRNQGLEKAKGDYIAFLDDDDIFYKNHLKDSISLFQKFPKISVVFGKEKFVHKGKEVDYMNSWIKIKLAKISKKEEQKDFIIFNGYILNNLIEDGCFLNPSAAMIKKDVVRNTGFFNENLWNGNDYEYWIRVSRRNKFGYLKKLQTTHVLHGENMSISFKKGTFTKEKSVILNHIKMFKVIRSNSFLTKKQKRSLTKNISNSYWNVGFLLRKKNKFKSLCYYLVSRWYRYNPVQAKAIKKLFIPGYYKK